MSDQGPQLQTVTTAAPGETSGATSAADLEETAKDTKALIDEGGSEFLPFEVRDREFRAVAVLPGVVLLDLGLAADPKAGDFAQLRAIRSFLDVAVLPEDRQDFDLYLREATPAIEITELNKIVEKLISLISGSRPTEPS